MNRLFKEHLNTTPHKYLQSHKFRYAKKLLQNTDLSMIEITSKIGQTSNLLSVFFAYLLVKNAFLSKQEHNEGTIFPLLSILNK